MDDLYFSDTDTINSTLRELESAINLYP